MKKSLARLYIILNLVITVLSVERCDKHGECACITDSGFVYDLSSLGYNGGNKAAFSADDTVKKYTYAYNPCHGYTDNTAPTQNKCNGVTVCQTSFDKNFQYPVGIQSQQTFKVEKENVVVKYTDGLGVRQAEITLTCGSDNKLYFVSDVDSSPSTYYLNLKHEIFCSSSGGLSIGSILTIIFFVLLIIYIVGGILYTVFITKSSGTAIIPNRDFWFALPGLIKDGFKFVFGLIKGRNSGYGQV